MAPLIELGWTESSLKIGCLNYVYLYILDLCYWLYWMQWL